MTIAFLAKMGQSGFDKIDLTEIDGFELITNENLSSWICRKFLYRTNNSYTDINVNLRDSTASQDQYIRLFLFQT